MPMMRRIVRVVVIARTVVIVITRTVMIMGMIVIMEMVVVMVMVMVMVVKALSHDSLLSRLRIEDCRIGLAASAMSAHHAASISSIDLTFSSSPCSRVNRPEPQSQVANSVAVANSAPQDSQRARPSIFLIF